MTRILAIVALLITLLYLAIFIASASYTLAFDYLAYDAAARRVIAGASPYDLALSRPGEFGLFFYPAPFLLLVLPLTILPPEIAAAVWIAGLVACFIAAILLLPVRDEVRWITLALAGLSWPLIFSVKVGQVAPILVLLFVIGWRWLDRPPVVGLVTALGTLIKIQPVLLFGWLLLERRWRDIGSGLVVIVLASISVTLVVGLAGWTDFVRLMSGLDDPLVQPANFSPGTIAYFLGVARPLAGVLQYGLAFAVVVLGIWLQRTGTKESSYLLAVLATQLVSPILWDHYALILVLPVAWLLQRRQWWAVLIPLSQSAFLLNVAPPIVWLAGWFACVGALVVIGRREERVRLAGGAVAGAPGLSPA
jgi:hypothetical protein